MSLWFRQRRKKNSAHEFSIHTVLCTVNRLLAERKAAVGFEGIWKILYDFKSNPDFCRGDLKHKTAPEGRDSAFLFANLALLDQIRTFFKENPDVEI